MPTKKPQNAYDRAVHNGFAQRLRRLRMDRDMSQSDVARAVWGTTTDSRGYEVARNRERISAYEQARSLPEPRSLELLAKALDVEPQDLSPELAGDEVGRQPAAVSMTMAEGQPDKVHLHVNTIASFEVASKVISLLAGDPVASSAGLIDGKAIHDNA